MKILSVKLVNYIGIFNGIGKREFSYDFTNATPIVIIEGRNGSGKSTLLNALHPFPDSNSDLIPGVPAMKHIVYGLNGNVYSITINYPIKSNGERDTSKISILKNGIECNKSLNVTTATQFIQNEFELDTGLLSLSQLSSEDKGLASKRPAERKRFVNSRLSDLSAYNAIHKTLTERSSTMKSMLNSLATKINNLGGNNVEAIKMDLNKLKKSQSKYQLSIEDLNRKIGALEMVKESLNFDGAEFDRVMKEVSSAAEKITMNNQQIRNICEGIDRRTNNIKLNFEQRFQPDNRVVCTYERKYSPDDIETYRGKYTLADLTNDISKSMGSTLMKKKLCDDRLERLEGSKQENKEIYDQHLVDLNKLKTELAQYAEIDNMDIDMDAFIKEFEGIQKQREELTKAIGKDIFDYASNVSSISVVEIANKLKAIAEETAKFPGTYLDMNILRMNIGDADNKISELNKKIADFQNGLDRLKSFGDLKVEDIPKECFKRKSKCKVVELLAKNLDNDARYNGTLATIENYKAELSKAEAFKDRTLEMMPLAKAYEDFKALKESVTFRTIKPCIDNLLEVGKKANAMMETFNGSKEVEALIGAMNILVDRFNLKTQLDQLNYRFAESYETYNAIKRNKDIIKSLNEKIDIIQSKMKLTSDSMIKLDQYIYQYDKLVEFYTDTYKDESELYSIVGEIATLEKKLNEFREKKERMLSSYTEYNKNDEKIKELSAQLTEQQIALREIEADIASKAHIITMIAEYKAEYDMYMQTYSKIETVKKFTSPTTGIQTLFMEIYMNNILLTANRLLELMFQGRYVLQPFVINENEFRIPCAGNGILNDDVTSMSLSQRSMIGMIINFAMLFNSSSVYNIIKLDEIDGGLDRENRVQFVAVLLRIMQIMGCEQCIMISHNDELDESPTHVIHLA